MTDRFASTTTGSTLVNDSTGSLPLGGIHAWAAAQADTLARLGAEHPDLVVDLGPVPSMEMGSDEIRIAFVGQHSAGKSSLIACLTGLDIPTGAGETTLETTSYEWNGHYLVDTPGARAGTDATRDRKAESATRTADIVVFTVTVEGFDDVTADLFASVEAIAPDGSVVLVVNKCDSEASDRFAIYEHLAAAVPTIDNYPLVWTDARLWLRAKATGSHSSIERSGLRDLAALLTDLAVANEAALHLRTRISIMADYSKTMWGRSTEDPEIAELLTEADQTIATVRARAAFARSEVQKTCRRAERALRADLVQAGPEQTADDIVDAIAKHSDLTWLASQEKLEIDASTAQMDGHPPLRLRRTTSGPDFAVYGPAAEALQAAIDEARKLFARDEIRPGTVLYDVTKYLLDKRKVPAKSWYVVGRLMKIGKGLDRAGKALPKIASALSAAEIATQGYNEIQSARREKNWPKEAARIAKDVGNDLERQWMGRVEVAEANELGPLESSRTVLLTSLSGQEGVAAQVQEVVRELDGLLGRLDNLQLAPQITEFASRGSELDSP